MIRELYIKNLALIESLSMEFEAGFTVFTGETGAGKSILVGAIGLLLGDRADADQIRSGCDHAEISAVFGINGSCERLAELLGELSIPFDDSQLIIRRRLSHADRSRIHVNEIPLSLSALRRIGDLLIDLHGQHEHQSLLNEETHRTIIDALEEAAPVRAQYGNAWQTLCSVRQALESHDATTRRLNEKRDMIEFQIRELEQAHLKTGEEATLEAELALLSSSVQRLSAVGAILELLGSSEGSSIAKQTAAIRRNLEQLAKYDPEAQPWTGDIENAQRIFSELETFCSAYISGCEEQTDPADRVEKINARLAKIQRLKKKYAATLDELIVKEKSLRSELAALDNCEADRKELEKALASAEADCMSIGKKLGAARRGCAARFDRSITAMMEKLGFKQGVWETVFGPLDEPAEYGLETVRFFVRTNPGEEKLPLAATASGGEISRLMLAIKTVLSRRDSVPVLIFDEIDTGIGGTVAGAVGKAMRELSSTHQVLCISHLHQIASLADWQIKVYKEQSGERTVTRIRLLSEEERVDEIARMLGGDSKIAIEHARELLMGKNG